MSGAPNMFTKSVEAKRKVAVSTPSTVIGTSAKDWEKEAAGVCQSSAHEFGIR